MAPRFRPSGWAGRDARLVGTRPRVRGCPRQCWHFCCLPALLRRSGDVGSLPPPRSSEIEATHPHVKCRTGACRWVQPAHGTGGGRSAWQGVAYVLSSVYSAPSIRRSPMPRRRSNPLALAVLACLTERPMHPYEMAATMRTRGQDASIRLNYGSLYGVVENLLKRGLLEEHEVVREGRRPERTVYRDHRRGAHRGRGLARRAAREVGQGVPAVRGGPLADGCAPAGPGSGPPAPARRRAAGAPVGAGRHRRGGDAQRRAARVPGRDGLRACDRRRRLRVHRAAGHATSSRGRSTA